MKDVDPDMLTNLAACFSLASVSSFFNQLRQPVMPSWREVFATCFYTGLSAIAIACLWIHFYGPGNITFMWFTSCLAGLGSADVLTAIWIKAIPAIVNFFSGRAIGKSIFNDPKDDSHEQR